MKKFLTVILTLIITGIVGNNAFAACLECPEIQKQLKKELNLTRAQKKEIKKIKKDMRAQIKSYTKTFKKNQKDIDKILNADCPDIVYMMVLKNDNSKIKKDILVAKKQAYGQIYDVYTEEQQYIAKRVLSENSGIIMKKDCEFCGEKFQLKSNCKKCNKKKVDN